MNFDSICPDLNILTRALASLVYKDLSNDERLSNLQPQFESNCGVFYLSAQNVAQEELAYIPIQQSKGIDFQLIRELQQKLNRSIIVAIVDNTGNILYYQITEGFTEK